MERFLEHLKYNFNGQDWSANGPKLVTKVMQEICQTEDLSEMIPEKCLGIQVFQPNSFYPVPWRNWKDFYKSEFLYNLNQSYSLHLWGRHSSHIKLKDLNENQTLYHLSRIHCPITFNLTFSDS